MTRLFASALLALTAGILLQADSDYTKALADFDSKKAELFKANLIKVDQLNKLYADLNAHLKPENLSMEQVVQLNERGFYGDPQYVAPIKPILQKQAAEPTLEGAFAAALQVDVVGGPKRDGSIASDEVRNDLIKTFLNHPMLPSLVTSKWALAAITGFGSVPTKDLKTKKQLVLQIVGPLLKSDPKIGAPSVTGYWGLVQRVTEEGTERQSIRQKLAEYLKHSLSAYNGDPKAKEIYTGQVALLNSAAAKGLLLNHRAPAVDFTWSTLPDAKNLAGLKGKVVVLDFWATWCQPCIESMPRIRELQDRYKGYDVVVLGLTSIQGAVFGLSKEQPTIDCSGDPQKEIGLMPAWLKAKDVSWDVAITKQPVFNPDFGVRGIPSMAVIDPKGVVRLAGVHPESKSLKEKAELIDSLLKESGLKTPPPL